MQGAIALVGLASLEAETAGTYPQRPLIIRYEFQHAQQRGNRRPLRKYGESHDGKGKADDGVAIRQVCWQGQGQSQRQGAAQATPKQDVMPMSA